jgi:DNA-binding XRE family transcriptional regulator
MYAPEWMLERANVIAGEIVNSADRGAAIHSYRVRMSMTQDELSGIARLRRETISRIENGKVTPTLAFIRVFSGTAALMEAVRSYRSKNMSVEYPYFIRIGLELGVPQDSVMSIVDMALHSYERKRKKAIRVLEDML